MIRLINCSYLICPDAKRVKETEIHWQNIFVCVLSTLCSYHFILLRNFI